MQTLLPTTKHRRGRRTARQERALAASGPALIVPEDLATDSTLGMSAGVVLDVGFGTGEAVIALAAADPDTMILAVDTHTPGVGDLLASIDELGLGNVRVVESDVRLVLEALRPQSLVGVRTFFPDPWPKKRHHRRRLVTAEFATALAEKVVPGGFWHLATDWPDYASWINEAMGRSQCWNGGIIARPADRPETRYERRGRSAGRQSIDLWFERTTA